MTSLLILLAALSVFLLIYGFVIRSGAACAGAGALLVAAALIAWAIWESPLIGFAV